jgi:hypothetical protein
MFSRKLLALVGAVLIGLMSVIPAFAASSSVMDLRLAPGSTICVGPLPASSFADAQGTATAGGANIAVFNGATNATNPVYLAFNSAGFHATFSTSLPQGAVFPGKFKLCATNPSTTTNTRVTMTLTTN